ncbi:MAG: hypothetical protein J2P54_18800 [Bradyrhizobiaceae bacterium]|nr:hypothetical protein [Bradyrhizobiaceae bacterium]
MLQYFYYVLTVLLFTMMSTLVTIAATDGAETDRKLINLAQLLSKEGRYEADQPTVASPAVSIVATKKDNATASPPSEGSCSGYNRTYADGSTMWCTVKPAAGYGCPLGLHFSLWTCRNGQWVKSQ